MTSSLAKIGALAIVTALVLSLLVSGTTVAAPGAGNESGGDETFAVQQGDSCYETRALGDGSKTVESFYNYSVEHDWSSEGTRHLQEDQVSNLFVYYGAEGYSLVFLHDEYGTGSYASTISMTVSGLPESGEWAVEDDQYSGRDDNFDHYGTRSEIDWMWAPQRTDGGAFRGLTAEGDTYVTIEPRFNEDADYWGDWAFSEGNHRIESWQFLGPDGSTASTLDMDQNVTVATGECDRTAPAASLSANSTDVEVNESVSFDASASSDDRAVAEYRWDFDGDGTVDRTTDSATATASYDASGEYDATVTVVDEFGNTDTASVAVSVTEATTEPPPAELTVSDVEPTDAGTEVTVPLSLTNDGEAQAFTLDVDAPESFSVTSQSSDGGTWNAEETRWEWETVGTGETVQPSVTLAVPEDASGNYTVAATAIAADTAVANGTGTVPVNECQSLSEAIDENDDGRIGDSEILTANEYWRTGEQVPGTCGKTVDDSAVLELTEMWRNETQV
ncbi:PKD domain-containing protein [Halosimplex sp. J119]